MSIQNDSPGYSRAHVCTGKNKLAPMLRADTDKRLRCPACWSVVSYGEQFPWKKQEGNHIRWWRYYRCACCGQRFARWAWLRREAPHQTPAGSASGSP